jgi:hypothetical protein
MQFIIDTIKWIRQKVGLWMWILAPVWIFVEVFLENLQVLITGVQQLRVKVSDLEGFVVNYPQVEMIWNGARYFFPVEAAMAMAAILLQLRIVALAIRAVKALVPVIWH